MTESALQMRAVIGISTASHSTMQIYGLLVPSNLLGKNSLIEHPGLVTSMLSYENLVATNVPSATRCSCPPPLLPLPATPTAPAK